MRHRHVLAAALAVTACAALPAAASATVYAGSPFRISNVGPAGDTSRAADFPTAAYNPVTRQHLVVWHGDDAINDRIEVFGRFVDANGNVVGGSFLIGSAGSPGDTLRTASYPRVAYNSVRNEFMVVYEADNSSVNDDYEIWGQRVGPTGERIGTSFEISDMARDNATYNGYQAQIAFDSKRDQYLVVWHGNDDSAGARGLEVWDHVVYGDGRPVRSDVRLTWTAVAGEWPTVVYNPNSDQYLVAFRDQASPTDTRISVRRVNPDGQPFGGNERVQTAGAAHKPGLAFNSSRNEYLVAWPQLGNGVTEIYSQRLDSGGAPTGGGNVQVSQMGAPPYWAGVDVGLGYSPNSQQYLATWIGRRSTTRYDEQEVFGQAVTADGALTGDGNFAISEPGPPGSTPLGSAEREALTAPVSFDPSSNRFLVVWDGKDDVSGMVPGEFEALGRLITPYAAPAAPPPPVVTPPPAVVRPPVILPPKVVYKNMSDKLKPKFRTRALLRKGSKLGQVLGIGSVSELPNGAQVRLVCVRACKGSGHFTLQKKKTKKHKKKVSLSVRPIVVTKKSVIEIRGTRSGYWGRWARFTFKRYANAIIAYRTSGGCLAPGTQSRHQKCPAGSRR